MTETLTTEQYIAARQAERERDQEHAEIRAKVREAATTGRPHRIGHQAVREAFEGHASEWAELAKLRQKADADRAKRTEAADDRAELKAMTRQVLAEWREDERQRAEQEARRRLKERHA